MNIFELFVKKEKAEKEKEEKRKEYEQKQKTKKGKQKGSYICQVYTKIYIEYLKSDKSEYFMFEDINVRKWENILKWLKKQELIQDYVLGDSIENACVLCIKGFNDIKRIYRPYLFNAEKEYYKNKIKKSN